MKKHIAVLIVCATVFALCLSVHGGERIPQIGILFLGDRNQPHLESFKQGLRDLGYMEGKNIVIEYRYAEGKTERLNELAKALVRDGVDIIVTTAAAGARAAREATKTIPIVVTSGNLLEVGLAKSLANPGGNITGLTVLAADLSGKRLELLKETLPKIGHIAALWTPKFVGGYEETRMAAKALSLRLHSIKIHSAQDLEPAFAEIVKARDSALVVVLSPLATLHSQKIVELAFKHKLPGIYPTRQFAEEGGLMAYGPLIGDLYRRAATYVDKILKGRRPADLPIEQPAKFELVINLKTAKQIGLTIPPTVLARADRVIK
jgi:putative ABC transport system substrate-binding protein